MNHPSLDVPKSEARSARRDAPANHRRALADIEAAIRLADRVESARYELDACGRATARAVLRGDDHAVGLHAREFAAVQAELDRLRAELRQLTGRAARP